MYTFELMWKLNKLVMPMYRRAEDTSDLEIYIYIFENRLFSNTIDSNYKFSFLYSSELLPTSLISHIHFPLYFPQKRAAIQETATKHYKTRYNKISQKPFYLDKVS